MPQLYSFLAICRVRTQPLPDLRLAQLDRPTPSARLCSVEISDVMRITRLQPQYESHLVLSTPNFELREQDPEL